MIELETAQIEPVEEAGTYACRPATA